MLIFVIGIIFAFCSTYKPSWINNETHAEKSQRIAKNTCNVQQVNSSMIKRDIRTETDHTGWQSVDSESLFYLFSSFFINSTRRPFILLIGAVYKPTYKDLKCSLINKNIVKDVSATYEHLPDDHLFCTDLDKKLCR